jgi:hypothetical protein
MTRQEILDQQKHLSQLAQAAAEQRINPQELWRRLTLALGHLTEFRRRLEEENFPLPGR